MLFRSVSQSRYALLKKSIITCNGVINGLGVDEIWYKAHTEYTVENTTALWFKDGEVSWFEDVE